MEATERPKQDNRVVIEEAASPAVPTSAAVSKRLVDSRFTFM